MGNIHYFLRHRMELGSLFSFESNGAGAKALSALEVATSRQYRVGCLSEMNVNAQEVAPEVKVKHETELAKAD